MDAETAPFIVPLSQRAVSLEDDLTIEFLEFSKVIKNYFIFALYWAVVTGIDLVMMPTPQYHITWR
jgi:hypothetical protein